MTPVRFLDEARVEFLEEVARYADMEPGLGDRFREAVEAAVALAETHPRLGSPWRHGTRRVFARGFPFSVVYRVETSGLIVLAVAHFRRRPTYWRGRT